MPARKIEGDGRCRKREMAMWVVNLVITAPDPRAEPLLLTVLLVALSLFAVCCCCCAAALTSVLIEMGSSRDFFAALTSFQNFKVFFIVGMVYK